MFGVNLLGLLGLLMVVVGGALTLAPRPTAFALRVLGVRLSPAHAARRAAGWMMVLLGLAIVVLTRAVR